MILIPEIETVLILTPRTGSGSLRRAVAAKYPRSMLIYRHMEADGVPAGYDRWDRLGVVRDPIARLWSLYKFCQQFGLDHADQGEVYARSIRASVERPFSDWIVNNEVVFTNPYDASGEGVYYPGYTVRHSLPENRKSQFHYLRPDLGTRVFPFEQLAILADQLGLDLPTHNQTADVGAPALSADAREHVWRWFAWDIAYRSDTWGLAPAGWSR
jgi:hypothetical protein